MIDFAPFKAEITPIAPVLLLAGAVITVFLALRTRRLQPFPGRGYFLGMLLAASWWAAAAAFESLSALPSDKIIWAELAWPGIVAAPTCWAQFIWAYVNGNYKLLRTRWRLSLLAMPLATCIIALTNSSHHLMYAQTTAQITQDGLRMLYIRGPWFYLTTVYLYVFMLLSMAAVINALPHASRVYRRHYLGFALAMVLPWIANIGYVTNTVLLFGFDPTPFSFLLMTTVFYWLISRNQLFDLLPVAHTVLLDAVPDAVLVLDPEQRIVECNRAATGLPGLSELWVGCHLTQFSDFHRVLQPLLKEGAKDRFDIVLGQPERHYELKKVSLPYPRKETGLLLTLRDITHRKLGEIQLHDAMAELEAQLETNLQLQQQLHEDAIRDVLTGLHNRRFLDELKAGLEAESVRSKEPLAAVMIDIDYFKRLNDTYGHHAGDQVLRFIAGFLQRSIRQSDYVFRMGGEEFLILLPNTSAEQAFIRAGNWCAKFATINIPLEENTISATFSAGIAVFPSAADSIDTLLNLADKALYQAKAAGRNRVECFAAAPDYTPGPPCTPLPDDMPHFASA
ncbi:histidine kinase N-terminal 7TM domain-containing protein [Herminiimonas sp. CN]|uniref:histidine kinase N-terminal 7TM domain-containing diguanylate cyclase n=1 Tax=Herminiimonas sp. CN TaxID=1349818 RepID=UPI00047428D3|nr:histidine kinase N-terminal 7TM domain-containing protein [Herminiimonas sp. CN]